MDSSITWHDGPPLAAQRARTLAQLVAACRARFGSRAVLHEAGRSWSWDELDECAAARAADWSSRLGPGDRVAILLPAGAAHFIAQLAAWRCGAIAAPVYRGLPASQRDAVLARLEPSVVVAEQGLVPGAVTAEALVAPGRAAASTYAACEPDTPAMILWTSGSSGQPRGVVLSHENLCSQQAAFAAVWPEVGPDDCMVGYLPWHHSFGALAEGLWALVRGVSFHVVPGEGRDREALRTVLQAQSPSVFMSVPRLHRDLHLHGGLDLSTLRWTFTAGAPLGQAERDWYAQAGVPVFEGWGLTETSPSATITRTPCVAGLVGEPIPGVSVGVDAEGAILVRGPGVMRGYWQDPVATQAVLTDGILNTGDVGCWEGPSLRLYGRSDHVLKLDNGEKLPVLQTECALAEHAAIRHAVVTVVDDELAAICEAAQDTDAVRSAVAALKPVLGRYPIRRTYVVARPFDQMTGTLTPSHKVVRGVVLAQFARWQARGGQAFRQV
ncbi:MAG: AMP-binding protein [Planctomycetota bacterium]|jgi:long-subunit acyl-CoA synthetase (AMP-forming)|nr:AMP-binding protein [Planctomycetota bacterium]